MKRVHGLGFFLLLSLTIGTAGAVAAQQSPAKPDSKKESGSPLAATSNGSLIARGRYLTVEVARCPDCHTPRNSNGELDRSKWLQGGPIWIVPVHRIKGWAERAPALAGFPYSDEQAQNILERHIGPNGIAIQPPMPAYRLNHADAVAIIAYLRSLPPAM